MVVKVQDSASPPQGTNRTFTVTFAYPTVPPITISPPSANQPTPRVMLPGYPVPLTATFTLSFVPNAASLPANYVNPAVQFATGGTAVQVNIPANSTAPVALPAVQTGSVAGQINVTLTALRDSRSDQTVPLPTPAPAPAPIVVTRSAPTIVPGSVRITNVTATGFQVTFDAVANTRELTRANVTFTAAPGTQLTGTQTFEVALGTAAGTWFPSAPGVTAGGAFSVTLLFGFTGDTNALGTASVTLTSPEGTSAAVSGGR
jgi:hypothetical protein